MTGIIPTGPKLRAYLMWGDVQLRMARCRLALIRTNGRWHAVIVPGWLQYQWLMAWRVTNMIRRLLMMVLVFSSVGWAAGPTEQRTAKALFHQVDGCTDITTLVVAVENQVAVSIQYPDGWARAAWLTVEENDTCVGIQRLNAAGQLDAVAEQLAIDRKLDDAQLSGIVTVWDGISQTQGDIVVTVQWTGIEPIDRSVWRTVQRRAEATLAADGFGLQLRNASIQATIKITK